METRRNLWSTKVCRSSNTNCPDYTEYWWIDKEHVSHYSPVLNAAFNSSFVEGQTQSYNLDDIRPDAFRLFVQWLYTQNFYTLNEISLADEEPTSEMAVTTMKLCQERDLNIIQVWLLADKFIIPRLQNYAMNCFLKILQNQRDKHKGVYRSTHWIPHVYADGRTSPDSPLRHLAIDTCLYSTSSLWANAHPDHFPHQMLMEMCSQTILSRVGIYMGALKGTQQTNQYTHTRPDRDYLVIEDKPESKKQEAGWFNSEAEVPLVGLTVEWIVFRCIK